MSTTIAIATVLFIVINILIAWWQARGITAERFIASRSSIGSLPLALSIAGTVIGGGLFFAVTEMGFQGGTAVIALPVAYIVGYSLLAHVVPRVRKALSSTGSGTLYEFLDVQYSDNNGPLGTTALVRSVAAVNFFIYFFSLAGQFVVLATFFKTFLNLSELTSWLVSLAVLGLTTLVYSVWGGLRKDIYTDVFQVILVLAGVLVIGGYLVREGVSTVITSLPPKFLNMTGLGVAFPIGVILFFSLIFIGRYDYWQRMIAATSDSSARGALWLSIPIVVVGYAIFMFLGMYVRASELTSEPNAAALVGMNSLLPSGAFLFVIVAMYGAVMSSADTLLNVSGLALSEVFGSLRSGDAEERLRFVRWAVGFVGLASSTVYFVFPDIVDLLVGAFSALTILSPIIAYSILAASPSARLALSSLASGMVPFLVMYFWMPSTRSYAFIISTVVSLLVLGLGWLIGVIQRRQMSFDAKA